MRELSVPVLVKADKVMHRRLPDSIWRQIDLDDHEFFEVARAQKREQGELRAKVRLAQTDMSMEELLAADEDALRQRMAKYRREL